MTTKIGRPTALTPERVEVVLGALRDGGTFTDAARAVGLSRNTVRSWAYRRWTGASPAFRRALREADARVDARRLARKYDVDAADVVRVLLGDTPSCQD